MADEEKSDINMTDNQATDTNTAGEQSPEINMTNQQSTEINTTDEHATETSAEDEQTTDPNDQFQEHALMVPEVIWTVGKFIPIWTREFLEKENKYEDKFQPVELTDLFLVCRAWHRALVPVLWECYDYRLMSGIPWSVLKANFHHVRYLSLLDKEHRKNVHLWEALERIQSRMLIRLEIHDPTYPVKRLLPPIREAHDPEAIEALTSRPPPPPRTEPVIVIQSSRAQRAAAARAGAASTTPAAGPARSMADMDPQGARVAVGAYGRAGDENALIFAMVAQLGPLSEAELARLSPPPEASSSSAPPRATTATPGAHQPIPLPLRPTGAQAHPLTTRYPGSVMVVTKTHPDPKAESPPLFRVHKNMTELWICGVKDFVHLALRSFLERQKQLHTLEIQRYKVTTAHWVQIFKYKSDLRRLILRRQTMLPGFDGEPLVTLPITHLEVWTDRIDLNALKTILRDSPDLMHLTVIRPQVCNIVVLYQPNKDKKSSTNPYYDAKGKGNGKGKDKDLDGDLKMDEEDDEDKTKEDEINLNIQNADEFAALLKEHGRQLKSFELDSNMPRWTATVIQSLPKTLGKLIIHSNQLEAKMTQAVALRRSSLTHLVLDLGSGLSRKGRLSGVRRIVRDCFALKYLEVHDHNNDNLLRRLLLRKSWATFNLETVKFYGVRGRKMPIMMQPMPVAVRDAGWNKLYIGKKYQCCETRSEDAPRPARRRAVVEDEPAEEAPSTATPPPAPTPPPVRRGRPVVPGPRFPSIDLRILEHLQQFPRLGEVVITETRYRRVITPA
ncbi:hypothetical protein BGX33_005763 [Mortierella sp. NVP41]|nr:hypothetical protein BGX33_005763 [Mortierella sp. NVP41]